LAIKRVSLPDVLTPWDDIFALKQDTNLQDRARKLRLWATDLLKSGHDIKLADEYLADALSDYENHIRAYKMKLSSSILRSVVVGTADFAEDLMKLRLGNVAAKLFAAEEKRADFLLAELKAPGRAVSLVSLLNERFNT
jgi:hypothetical protein